MIIKAAIFLNKLYDNERLTACEIWGSHSIVSEDSALLGTWRCVFGWVVFDVLRIFIAFIFKGVEVRKRIMAIQLLQEHSAFGRSGTTHPKVQNHILDGLISHASCLFTGNVLQCIQQPGITNKLSGHR